LFSSFTLIFFFTDPAPTQIYTLSLHDALPISSRYFSITSTTCRRRSAKILRVGRAKSCMRKASSPRRSAGLARGCGRAAPFRPRSEEHTSELQSRRDLVCRLLLEKKKIKKKQR